MWQALVTELQIFKNGVYRLSYFNILESIYFRDNEHIEENQWYLVLKIS